MKKQALKLAEEVYQNAWETALSREEKKPSTTFREAAELYVSAGGESRFLPRIIDHFGPDMELNSIGAMEIAQAAAAIYPEAKKETIRRQLKVPIKAVQNFAAGNRRERMEDTRRVRWLTPEEAERLIVSASRPETIGLRDPDLQTLRKIAFMLGTGVGPGETISLIGDHWNSSTRQWWLPGTKSVFRARYVTVPTRSIDLIGSVPGSGVAFPAPNGQPYVLRSNGGGQMAEAFRKVREAADLGPDVVPYSLRHTWATWFYAQTKDWGSLLDQGGWNKSDTANRYRKIAPADLGNRLLAYGWDFRPDVGPPVRFGELVSIATANRKLRKTD